MVSNKTNRTKLWSDSPTSAHVTDVCKSVLQIEWTCATDWIPQCVSEFRWLLVHCLDKPVSSTIDWPEEDNSDSDDEDEESDKEMQVQKNHQNKFGPIPRF